MTDYAYHKAMRILGHAIQYLAPMRFVIDRDNLVTRGALLETLFRNEARALLIDAMLRVAHAK